MIYIQEHLSDSEEIIKYSIFQMYIVCDTHINELIYDRDPHSQWNKTFTKDSLKQSISIIKQYFIFQSTVLKVIKNIIYLSTVNQMDGYMDAWIIPTPVKYIISRDKEINK